MLYGSFRQSVRTGPVRWARACSHRVCLARSSETFRLDWRAPNADPPLVTLAYRPCGRMCASGLLSLIAPLGWCSLRGAVCPARIGSCVRASALGSGGWSISRSGCSSMICCQYLRPLHFTDWTAIPGSSSGMDERVVARS